MTNKFNSGLRIDVCLFLSFVTSELCSKQINITTVHFPWAVAKTDIETAEVRYDKK